MLKNFKFIANNYLSNISKCKKRFAFVI